MPSQNFSLLGLIVLFPLIGAIINGVIGSKLPRKLVDWIACGSILLSFLMSLATINTLISGATTNAQGETVYGYLSYTAYEWIYSGALHVDLAFMVDPLTSLLLLLITGVGFLIHLYSTSYMSEDPSKWRYFSYLNLFCFAMLLLVMGKNLLVSFVGWEGVGACSYLLIGFWYTDDEKAAAGQKAFIVNRVGDFAFLVGLFVLFYEARTLDYVELSNMATTTAGLATLTPIATIVMILMFIGCTGKSAQIPLFVWLPDAMAGPTPVSALIHAATMVTSGVFLLSRLNWLLTISWQAMMIVAWVGALTAFFAATIALVQNDIKKVLAYSTVSQLGYMFLAVGVGSFTGAVFHLMTHAFFKALLFLGSGSVIHAMHDQDIRNMGGLKKYMPVTRWTFLIGCLAISGVPFFSGFFSKDAILWGALSNTHVFQIEGVPTVINLLSTTVANPIQSGAALNVELASMITRYGTFALAVITAGLTAFYMFRLYILTFEGECRASEETKSHLHESPPAITIPLAVLALLALIGGLTGWPHFIAHTLHWDWMLFFEHWFSELFAVSHTYRIANVFGEHPTVPEIVSMVAGLTAAGTGIGMAAFLYIKRPELPAKFMKNPIVARLHALLDGKYFVDEGYNKVFVEGSVRSGEGMTFFDKNVLDGVLVNGTAQIMATAGRILRHLQSGNVQRYATYITLGVLLTIFALFKL